MMRVVVDINVVLDVFQERQPFYSDSASLLGLLATRQLVGVCPAHGLTTIYYLMARHEDRTAAMLVVDQLLADFEIVDLEHAHWLQARALGFTDFEDAAVAQVAVVADASWIITRNAHHFKGSPIPAVTPTDFLRLFFPALVCL